MVSVHCSCPALSAIVPAPQILGEQIVPFNHSIASRQPPTARPQLIDECLSICIAHALQILDEQIVAFNHNIAIIRAFKVSWRDRIQVRLLPVYLLSWL